MLPMHPDELAPGCPDSKIVWCMKYGSSCDGPEATRVAEFFGQFALEKDLFAEDETQYNVTMGMYRRHFADFCAWYKATSPVHESTENCSL